MKINFSYVLVLSFTWMLTASTCDKDCNDSVGTYKFVIPVSISPTTDTIRIGDTLTIVSVFENEVLDRTSMKTYLLDSFLFFPVTNLFKIDSLETSIAPLDLFDYFIDENKFDYSIASFSDGSKSLTGSNYAYDGNTYSLVFKLIPRQIGTFFLQHGCSIDLIDQNFPGYCERNGMKAVTLLNENDGNNLYLLEDSPDPHFSEWILAKPKQRFYDLGGYAFVVVE